MYNSKTNAQTVGNFLWTTVDFRKLKIFERRKAYTIASFKIIALALE